jgi:hypothetical protein
MLRRLWAYSNNHNGMVCVCACVCVRGMTGGVGVAIPGVAVNANQFPITVVWHWSDYAAKTNIAMCYFSHVGKASQVLCFSLPDKDVCSVLIAFCATFDIFISIHTHAQTHASAHAHTNTNSHTHR